MSEPEPFDPTLRVNLDFGDFILRRRDASGDDRHADVADYAFDMDRVLRQKLTAFGPARKVARMLVHHITPIQRQLHMMGGVAVGPNQFPEIHAQGAACARQLGIGVPQIFIVPSPFLDAYTYATDDIEPMLVLSSALIDALSPEERLFVIGHECGHIANLHGAYNSVVQSLVNPLAKAVTEKLAGVGIAMKLISTASQLQLLSMAVGGGVQLFLKRWSRCAEVTCDRAGLICCGDLITAQRALARVATGGAGTLEGIDIDHYIRQIGSIRSSAMRFQELFQSHPLIPKRLEAMRLFASCEVLYRWRPDIEAPADTHPLAEIDAACAAVIGISSANDPPLEDLEASA
ncbi:MAG: M48 family metallopeptidase [Acidobacteriota bacterium]